MLCLKCWTHEYNDDRRDRRDRRGHRCRYRPGRVSAGPVAAEGPPEMSTSNYYVEFPSGTRYPDGYITPCEIIKTMPGWVKVKLTGAGRVWSQWVREHQVLADEDVETV